MSDTALADGVIWQGCLSVAWSSERVLLRSRREINAYLLVLNDYEQHELQAHEQPLLHAKLDLALAWLARSQSTDFPAAVQVELGLSQLRWRSESALPVGTAGVLTMNLSNELPCMIEFAARIVAVIPDADGMQQLCAELDFADEEQEEAYSRLIFGRHRRMIQQQRKG